MEEEEGFNVGRVLNHPPTGPILPSLYPLVFRPTRAATLQGLTLAHVRAQLEDLQDTSLTLKLNLSTFETHPRLILGTM
jgi:hypothetical protein